MARKTINQEVLDELLKYAKDKGQRSIQGIIDRGASAGQAYLNSKGNDEGAAKKLWVCNYALVELLRGEEGKIKVEYYTDNKQNNYYEFDFLNENFLKEVLTFDKSEGFSIGNLTNFKDNLQKDHNDIQKLSNKLFNATKSISDLAKDTRKEGATGNIRLEDTGTVELKGMTRNEDLNYYQVQLKYSRYNPLHYIYIKFRSKDTINEGEAAGYGINQKSGKKYYFYYYYGAQSGFENAKYYNYGWLREHSLEVARNKSKDNKFTLSKVRQTFTEKTENVPGYRVGDVNNAQIKYKNKHLMGADTLTQLANMFKKLKNHNIYDASILQKSFYSSTATMQLDKMVDILTDDFLEKHTIKDFIKNIK